MSHDATAENLLRELAPLVLGVLVRRYGQFELCEDAVQEAVLDAVVGWPADGVPDNPRAWLMTAASRRAIDLMRSDSARRAREVSVAASVDEFDDDPAGTIRSEDDTLILLFLCCHPVLTPASQIALTLRAVGGLTTLEIASAFLVPESTMGARISRAKQGIKAAGSEFSLPAPAERDERLRAVLHALYLIFNEGYTASSGSSLHRADLTREAIRLTRMLHQQLPNDGEVTGLLALMLLTDARRLGRSDVNGDLVPLAVQDRTRWDADLIREGAALVNVAMEHAPLGPYQLQAAIAATHAAAESADETDWSQVHALYKILERIAPNPMVTLNRAVALAEVEGPRAGLELLATLDADQRMTDHHRLHAVRAHFLEQTGSVGAARREYELAARTTASLTERRYLESRASRLDRAEPA